MWVRDPCTYKPQPLEWLRQGVIDVLRRVPLCWQLPQWGNYPIYPLTPGELGSLLQLLVWLRQVYTVSNELWQTAPRITLTSFTVGYYVSISYYEIRQLSSIEIYTLHQPNLEEVDTMDIGLGWAQNWEIRIL